MVLRGKTEPGARVFGTKCSIFATSNGIRLLRMEIPDATPDQGHPVEELTSGTTLAVECKVHACSFRSANSLAGMMDNLFRLQIIFFCSRPP